MNFPTRLSNTLDLFLSNRPTLINRIEPMPGVSDHDIVYVNSCLKPERKKPPKRKILLWKKADMDELKLEVQAFVTSMTTEFTIMTPVETIWMTLKKHVEDTTSKCVPSKMSSSRHNQPWINRTIKRLARRKQRAFNKARSSNLPKDWARLHKLQKLQKLECKKAFHTYIMDIISLDLYERPKRFWSYIKNMKCDNNSVAPLRGQDG